MTNKTNLFFIAAFAAILLASPLASNNAFAQQGNGNGNNNPNSLKGQVDANTAAVDSFFDVFTEIAELFQVDSFFDVFTELQATDEDLQSQIDAISEGPADPAIVDTHEQLRDQSITSYNAAPCNRLNPSITPVLHLMDPEGKVLTAVDFEELPNDFPFYAYASISDPTLAEVVLFAGNFAPRSWAFTEGQTLDIASNTALFSLLGTTYGGDGRTNFQLPDMRCLEADEGPRHIIALQGIFPSRN